MYDGGHNFNILGILACISKVIFYYETYSLENMPFTFFKCWCLAWGTQVDGHPYDSVFLGASLYE